MDDIRVFKHPDEEWVSIGADLNEARAAVLDGTREVLTWEQFVSAVNYAARHHHEAFVVQQYNCGHCGMRQTFMTPWVFYETGRCEECHEVTDLKQAGAWLIGLDVPVGSRAKVLQLLMERLAEPDHYDVRHGSVDRG